jgi:hypothetical protein
MNIYESWFKEQLTKWPKRIFSIGGNKIFENGEPATRYGLKNTDGFFNVVSHEDSNNFCKKGVQALLNAIKHPQYSKNLKQELNSLLFPGENKVTQDELETAIKAVCAKGIHE